MNARVASGPQLWVIIFVAAVAVVASVLLSFGVTLPAVALAALVVSPLALYGVLNRPLDIVFGLYVLLIPFDNLLSTGSFGTLTKFVGIVAGIALLLFVARRGQIKLTASPVFVLFALVGWMLLSVLWALNQGAAVKILPTYAGLVLLYVAVTMMPVSRNQWRRLLFLVVIGGVASAGYGIHLFYGQLPNIQNSAAMRLIVQAGDNFIDPNHFSDALLFPVAVLAMWGLRSRTIFAKVASLAGVGIMVCAILLSGSREGVVALLLIVAYYLWRTRYRLQVAVMLIATLAALTLGRFPVMERFASVLQTGGSGRTSIWAVAIEAAKHRLLQGFGIGNFVDAFNQFYLGVHQPYPYGWDSPAHNLVMHYLVELGLVGLVLIAGFFISQFRSLKYIGKDSPFYDDRVAMEAALLATISVSLTIDLFTYKYAWLVFAMAALLRNAASAAQQAAIRATSSSITPARSARSASFALPASPIARSATRSSCAS